MTFIWLVAWLLNSTPDVHRWNNWLVALIVCLLIDVFVGESAS